MTDTAEDLALDPQRDAWLTPRESANWDALALVSQFDVIGDGDVAVVLGAGSGGIASWLLNDRKVAHVVVVEDDERHSTALRRNFSGRAGATVLNEDPASGMQAIIGDFWPSIVVLDLGARTTDRDVIMALAGDLDTVMVLVVIYEPLDERAVALHNMIASWHALDPEDNFVSAFGDPAPLGPHRPNAMIAWYSR